MDWLILAVSGLTLAVAAVGSWFAYTSDRRNSERSDVQWQVERVSEGVFRAVNVGSDPAYEVTMEAWDKFDLVSENGNMIERFNDLTITLPTRKKAGPEPTGVPKPLTLSLPEESVGDVPDFLRPPPTHPLIAQLRDNTREQYEDMIRDAVKKQVTVKVVWRSKRGRWSEWKGYTG